MATTSLSAEQRPTSQWLFSPAVDLWTFLGSAILALALLAVGAPLGLLESDTPDWMWIGAILMIDVAHVYSTGFRVYFDLPELKRRPWLYGLTPLLAFLVGAAIYSEGKATFWTLLAYLAVFHFVRQQYGWVALYRSRAGETGKFGFWVDAVTIYMATLYPLVHWHSNLPRNFWWFLEGDFHRLPASFEMVAAPIYWATLLVYLLRLIYRGVVQNYWCPGKDIVVITTAICWYVGIVAFNSDYAFTVTNVIIHGVPYMVLVYWYRCIGYQDQPKRHVPKLATFLGIVWMLAYLEEFLWDTGVWNERSWLFGPAWSLQDYEFVLVPLLAVPQITHYVLDGFIWKRKARQGMA